MIIIRQEIKTVHNKQLNCFVVQCDDFIEADVHVELYAVAKHFRMVTEGPRDGYFDCEVVQNGTKSISTGSTG